MVSNTREILSGRCISCRREAEDAMQRATTNSIKTAMEEDDRRKQAQKERERAEKEARRERKRKEEERADEIEKTRLAKAAAAEKLRQENKDKAKREAKRKQQKEDARQAELRRQRELDEAEDEIRRQEDLDEIAREKRRKREEDRREAEHQEKLRRKRDDANRRQAERDEAERQEAAEQQRIEQAEFERRQKEIEDQNQVLARAAQEAKDRDGAAERLARMEAEEAAASELDRKLTQRRFASETQATPAPPPEQIRTKAKPASPPTKPTVDIAGVIGNHGSPELGYGMIGGRRIPIHESQRRPEPLKTAAPPPVKRGPTPISRLGGTIASSPHDYKIQQPSLVATPGTPTPDWKKNIRKTSVSTPVPAPESTGVDAELRARLAKQRAWEAEQEKKAASDAHQENDEPDWEVINKPISSTTPATPISPPPTYPVVPPLAHPKLESASPALPAKRKPPVPVKRMSSASSPSCPTPVSAQTAHASTHPSIPTPPPISSLPSRMRVDSAAPSPRVDGKAGGNSDWDDSGSEDSESEGEGQFGGSGDGGMGTKQFSPGDVFGGQRRKGWKAV